MALREIDKIAEIELIRLIGEDETHASGYYEYLGATKVIDQGKETDIWYQDWEEFGAMSFFHTLCNGRKVHVRVCCGD